jgi:hypothetical protein
LGAKIALGRPDFLEFARDWTLEAMKHIPGDAEIVSQRAEVLLLSCQTREALDLWQTLWERERQPRFLAALVICELVEDAPLVNSMAHERELGPVGRAFIDWYRQFLTMRSEDVIAGVNRRLENLRSVMPAVAGMLEAALAEAGELAPSTEPCLA